MDRANELASALRALAVNEGDQDLADTLLEAIQKVERFADYKLRNQTQGVLGDAQVTLQERLDSLFNVARDTHQLVFSVQQEQQLQGAALVEVRATFLAWAERLTGVEETLRDHAEELAAFRKSRDVSIKERKELKRQYEESKQDRSDLRQQGQETRGAVDALAERLDAFIAEYRRGKEAGDGG